MTLYGMLWFTVLGGCFGFVLGWIFGRKEFAYWLVRSPRWQQTYEQGWRDAMHQSNPPESAQIDGSEGA